MPSGLLLRNGSNNTPRMVAATPAPSVKRADPRTAPRRAWGERRFRRLWRAVATGACAGPQERRGAARPLVDQRRGLQGR